MILTRADHRTATVRPSPNFGERKDGKSISAIILHYTGMVSGIAAEDWLCNSDSEVSSHYLVHEDGRIVQMVAETDRAWHAGKSYWKGETDLNSVSVGIEIVNAGHILGYKPFPQRQINAVIRLCTGIILRHGVQPDMVLAHSDIAPGRKIDPGELFPWDKLAAKGIGQFVQPAPISGGRFFTLGDEGQPIEALQSMLVLFGFDVAVTGIFDATTQKIVTAFQRHHRPEKIDGIADVSTIQTLYALLRPVPVLA
ncbi:MAG: peptidoglycan recognition protein family protein [Rhizobiaceae bacterium]